MQLHMYKYSNGL